MDLTFRIPEGVFNLRAAAVILHEGRILAMQDERSPYYYIPGGRVGFGETAEAAVLREVHEELGIDAQIIRPLWLNQGFFNEGVAHVDYREVALYFLVDVTGTDLLSRGDSFTLHEGRHTHRFQWLPIDKLRDEYFYPLFLKDALFSLPDHLTLLSTAENALPTPGAALSFAMEKGHFSLQVCGVYRHGHSILTTPAATLRLHEDFPTALEQTIGSPCIGQPLFFDQRFTHLNDGSIRHELCLYMLLSQPVDTLQTASQAWLISAMSQPLQPLQLVSHRF